MEKVLTDDQKRQLAEAIYAYLKHCDHSREAFLSEFADRFGTKADYVRTNKMTGARPLNPIEADWSIKQMWGMLTTRKIRELFKGLFNDRPETYGFHVPDYQDLSDFQKWKVGLGKIIEHKKQNQVYQ